MDLEKAKVLMGRTQNFPFIFPLFPKPVFAVGEVMASRTPGFTSPVLIKCYTNRYVCVLSPNMMAKIFETSLCSCTQKYGPTNSSFNMSHFHILMSLKPLNHT